MDICLEPDVVLYHLKHILGEDIAISNKQLYEFIADLKKIIKRDQRRRLNEKENTQPSICGNTATIPCKCHVHCCNNEDTSSVISGVSSRSSSSYIDPKPKKTDVRSEQPTSAFIKPWRLNPPPKGMTQKCDPVQLYQQYQEQWKQVRVPGETGHERLRWTIRERMLGQDPQPRAGNDSFSPCDCGSHFCHQSKCYKNSNLEEGESECNRKEKKRCCSCDCCDKDFRCRNCPSNLGAHSQPTLRNIISKCENNTSEECNMEIRPLFKDSPIEGLPKGITGSCCCKSDCTCTCRRYLKASDVQQQEIELERHCNCICCEAKEGYPVKIRVSKNGPQSWKMSIRVKNNCKCLE